MSDFTIRSGSVDVEQIMQQIRARIREKRGVDYTEAEIRELASVKLEKFLDPENVRSDLLEHYRRRTPGPPMPPLPAPLEVPKITYSFEADTIYVSSRGVVGVLLRLVRRLLNPLLKLFFNPNPLIHGLHLQAQLNTHLIENLKQLTTRYEGQLEWIVQRFKVRDELDALNYEVLNNLVVELTRLGIEVKNLKMRVESVSSRLDFDERRSRALEGIVQYRPGPAAQAGRLETEGAAESERPAQGEGGAPRRRRRRRGRRRGAARPPQTAPATPTAETPPPESASPPEPDPDEGPPEP